MGTVDGSTNVSGGLLRTAGDKTKLSARLDDIAGFNLPTSHRTVCSLTVAVRSD